MGELMFGENKRDSLKRTSSDELYLKSLKDKIDANVKKAKKNFKDQEPPVEMFKEKKEAVDSPKVQPKNNEMAQLKLKEKERKRKKQEAVFQQKVETSVDKVKDMSLKSQKLEKISAESEQEILKSSKQLQNLLQDLKQMKKTSTQFS